VTTKVSKYFYFILFWFWFWFWFWFDATIRQTFI